MSVELDSTDVCCGSLPDQLEVEAHYLAEALKLRGYGAQYFQALTEFFRDRFYLPLNLQPIEPFFVDSSAYAAQFVEMLKGNNLQLDPTFPNLPIMIDHFNILDVPVKVRMEKGVCIFQTRVIESKEEIDGKKLRLILFSFYGHHDDECNAWNPLTSAELSSAPLDVLRAFQEHVMVNSMMTFSLGV